MAAPPQTGFGRAQLQTPTAPSPGRMNASTMLLALSLAFAGVAFLPSAAAADVPDSGCLVGDRSCLVGVEWVVCVTEPCDGLTVCLNHGAICRSF